MIKDLEFYEREIILVLQELLFDGDDYLSLED